MKNLCLEYLFITVKTNSSFMKNQYSICLKYKSNFNFKYSFSF